MPLLSCIFDGIVAVTEGHTRAWLCFQYFYLLCSLGSQIRLWYSQRKYWMLSKVWGGKKPPKRLVQTKKKKKLQNVMHLQLWFSSTRTSRRQKTGEKIHGQCSSCPLNVHADFASCLRSPKLDKPSMLISFQNPYSQEHSWFLERTSTLWYRTSS